MIESYLHILEDGLKKKLEILSLIEVKSIEQSELLKNDKTPPEMIDQNMDDKLALIQEIVTLDNGFEGTYEKIREELEGNKEKYKELIINIQGLISKVTEKNVSIQAIEARNKAQMEIYLSTRKKALQSKRSAMSIANDYYQNMNKVKHVSPQFLDKKK